MAPWTNLTRAPAPKVAEVRALREGLRSLLAKAVPELPHVPDEAVLEPHLPHQLAGAEVVGPLLDDDLLEEPEARMVESAERDDAAVHEPRPNRDRRSAVAQHLRRMVASGDDPAAAAQRVGRGIGGCGGETQRREQGADFASLIACHPVPRRRSKRSGYRQPTGGDGPFRVRRSHAGSAQGAEAIMAPRRRGRAPRSVG